MVRTMAVHFSGVRAAEGPMTLGQRNMDKWLRGFSTDNGVPAYGMQFWSLRPDPGVTVADVAETVAVLLARHEGLRTHYLDHNRQRVLGSGELPLHVVRVDDDVDQSTVDKELDSILDEQPYDPATQLPVCVVLAIRDDQVLSCVVRCSHLAADHKAMVILGTQIEQMLADRTLRIVGTPTHQPLDQAEFEQTPAVRRRTESALDYWRDRMRRMPANPLASPRRDGAGESGALEMASHVAATAVRRVEERTALDRSTIVLAAVLSVLAIRSGYSTQTFCALSGNRFFGRRLAGYVGTLAASSLAEVDCAAASFDQLGEHVRNGMLRASLNGMYDAYRLHAIAERVERERGIAFHCFPPIFNNATHYYHGQPVTPVTTTAPTEFSWRPMPATPAPLRFDLWRANDVLAMEAWTADTDRISRHDIMSMLLAVERLLLAAAEDDLDPRAIATIVDLAPISRDEGWLFLDSCWVHLPEVQRLLDDALPHSRAVATVAGHQLVAYVAATNEIRTPADAHTRCMAHINRYPAAMAPRYYILCDLPPANPDDESAWQRQAVVDQGPGREIKSPAAVHAGQSVAIG